jgi:FKBP-type peptidyl-prolyl cis-trans isomerase
MQHRLIPGILAIGLATAIPSMAKSEAPKEEAAKTATTQPVTATEPKEAAAPEAPATPPPAPEVVRADSSYGFGFRTGSEFAQQYGRFGITAKEIDSDSFAKGFMAALKGGKPEIPEERLKAAMKALGDSLQKHEQEIAATNLDAGKKFLAENGKRPGVITTKSGLQYEVITKGGDKKYEAPKEAKDAKDAKPEDNKQFMVNYKGTLMDGTQFDASPAGQPVPMTLQVIEGFKEALTNMPIGSKWKLFIPGNLAYGPDRRSAQIAPNTLLIFELELVEIKDAPPAPAGGAGSFPMPVQPEGGE